MEINVYVLFGILVIHFIADFVLQTDWQAKNKSSSMDALLTHTGTYSLVWLIISMSYCCYVGSGSMLLFAPITFVAHTITDFYTSRVNSQLYKDGKIHEFFIGIGADQVMHYVQLVLTYKLLD